MSQKNKKITPDYDATPVLSARNLTKKYGRVVALDNTSFELYPGEILGVIGDNGAGKSTMIKVLSGAVQAEGGEMQLEGKPVDFVGDRSLHSDNANRPDRKQLVGLKVPPGAGPLPTGAHLVDLSAGTPRSVGFVTSSYDSPNLGYPIALALVEGGAGLATGTEMTVWHMGRQDRAYISPPCFYDPQGARLHG